MARPHFEATEHWDPDDDRTERARRRRLSGGRVLLWGAFAGAVVAGAAYAQHWLTAPRADTALAAVREQAAEEQKHVALYFVGPGCDDCERMERESWGDASVRVLARRSFVRWTIGPGVHGWEQLAEDYQVGTLPTVVLTAASGAILSDAEGRPLRAEGYLDADVLRDLLSTRPGADARRRTRDGAATTASASAAR